MKRNQGPGHLIVETASVSVNGNLEAIEITTVQEKLFVRIECEMKSVVVGTMNIVPIVITMIVNDETKTVNEVVSETEEIEGTEEIVVTEQIAVTG